MQYYEDVTGQRKISVFPPELQRSIVRLCARMTGGELDKVDLAAVVSGLSVMPPEAYLQAAREIVRIGGLYHYVPERSFLRAYLSRPNGDPGLRVPGLEYLCLFHGNGYIRERALSQINGPLQSEFYFNCIAYRLNDWVKPVRKAAHACATRVFPQTAAAVIAKAAFVLLERMSHWQRASEEISILEETLARPDVVAELIALVKTTKTGSPSRVVTYALKSSTMDSYLLDLSRTAWQPGVRALALRTLLKGYAVWPDGLRREWIDKSMGRLKQVTAFSQRELSCREPVLPLIRQGAADKAVMVRRVASDGLVENRRTLSDLDELVSLFTQDKSASVRERAFFILRERAERLNRA